MTLRLSDDQLARLRLECWKAMFDAIGEFRFERAEYLVAWCLRDRPVEPEET